MKRTLSLILIIIMVSSLMLGCAFLPDSIRISEVNFYVDGELYTTKTVNTGSTVSAPIAPKKENHIFVGWYSGGIFNYEFDFSNITPFALLTLIFAPPFVAVTNVEIL